MPPKTKAAPAGAGGRAQPAPKPRAFRVGVQSHEENNYDQTVTMTSSTQDLPVFEPPPQGFLRGITLLVELDSTNS